MTANYAAYLGIALGIAGLFNPRWAFAGMALTGLALGLYGWP